MLKRKGLYCDVIGVIVDFVGGDKAYWKRKNNSVIHAITNGCQKVNFDTLKNDFIHFISVQHEYDTYNDNDNGIANTMKETGKSIGIRAYLEQQHIVAKIYCHRLIRRLRRSVFSTPSLYDHGAYEQSKHMLVDFDFTPSIYKFGNIRNVNRIMNDRWVGSISQQDKFSLLLEELKHTFEKKRKQKYIEIRQTHSFQVGRKLFVENKFYEVINVYRNSLRFQTEEKEIKFRRFMKDNDNCTYVFVDRMFRYKYYTDHSMEKVW